MEKRRLPQRGEAAIVVADLPMCDEDNHGVTIGTRVTVGGHEVIKGKKAYCCTYFRDNEMRYCYFYAEELRVMDAGCFL